MPLKEALLAISGPYLATRLLLVGVSCAIALIRHHAPLDVWYRWDAMWYLGIAQHDYSWRLHWHLHGESTLAFFPMYPLLIRLLSGVGVPALLASMLVSNAAFAGALTYLYRLARLQLSPAVARRAVWLLALFPTAFFTFAPYTEALFLLCAIASFYHAGRGDRLAAGVWAAIAVLTRSTGFALLPALVSAQDPRRIRTWALTLGPAAVGWCLYLAYLMSSGVAVNGLLHAQRAWHRALTFPWTGFVASIDRLVVHRPLDPGQVTENVVQLSVTLIFLLFCVLARRELGTATTIFCAGFWLLVLSTPEWLDGYFAPFSSVDRFVLVLFPLTIWGAKRLRHHAFTAVSIVFAAAMTGAAAVHLVGGWVG